jgi:hypothetical protein
VPRCWRWTADRTVMFRYYCFITVSLLFPAGAQTNISLGVVNE